MVTWSASGRADAQIRRAVRRDIGRRARNVNGEARRIADRELKRRTGRYHGGFQVREISGASDVAFAIVNTARHSKPIEFGTRAHVIRPRPGGKFLRFAVGGRVVFARQVNHPGTRQYAPLRTALARRYRP